MPDRSLCPDDADGRMARKLQSSVPFWVIVNWNCPRVPLEVVAWLAFVMPHAVGAALEAGGAPLGMRTTATVTILNPTTSVGTELLGAERSRMFKVRSTVVPGSG